MIRDFQESHEEKQFRIDVPKGADEPFETWVECSKGLYGTVEQLLRAF